jgi:hypothetical protein
MNSFAQSIREAFQWQLMIQTAWEFDWSASHPTFHTVWIRAPFSTHSGRGRTVTITTESSSKFGSKNNCA